MKGGFPLHGHECTELFCITGGEAVHTVDKESYPVSKGDIFVIHHPQSHGFDSPDGMDLVNIQYDRKNLALPWNSFNRIPGYHALFILEPTHRISHGFKSRLKLGGPALEVVRRKLDEMIRLFLETPAGFEAEITAVFIQFVLFLSREFEKNPSSSGADLLRIGRVLQFMEQEYARTVRLEDLAAAAHLSENQFLRIFRRATGFSPMEFLRRKRLEKGAELLSSTPLSVTEVAMKVGFGDGNYFSRQFKQLFGVRPSVFRYEQQGR